MRSRPFIHSRKQGGFTLVEMLVSVALVIVLMLAITQIFTITSKTMGGSQAVSAGIRDAQAAQTVIGQDLANAASDGACFVINNQRIEVPSNLTDYGNIDTGGTNDVARMYLTEDVDGDGKIDNNDYLYSTAKQQTYSPLEVNHRSHRKDFLMFCARGNYPRQTANPGRLISEMSSREAVIFYHHLNIASGDGTLFYPGQRTLGSPPYTANTTNFFSNQWILGRVAMLMVSPQQIGGVGHIFDKSGPSTVGSVADQNFFPDNGGLTYNYRYPFYPQSKATVNYSATSDVPATTTNLVDARYDLIGMSISQYREKLQAYIDSSKTGVHPSQYPGSDVPPNNWRWDVDAMGNDDNRFRAVSYLSQPNDINQLSQKIARTTPIFLPSCSQFVVEFAGDFIIQDWDPSGNGIPDEAADRVFTKTNPNTARGNTYYGRVVGAGTDSRTDTCPLTSQIRWYGLPRDTNDDRRIIADEGDVATLRDVIGARQTIEKSLPTTTPDTPVPTDRDYNNSSQVTLTASPSYTVAWGPSDMANKPKMIRITIAIDRPESEGKLNEAQTFQYVFKVGL